MSVPRLNIPVPHREALQWLATTSVEGFSAGQAVLNGPLPTIDRAQVAEDFAEAAGLELTVAQELLDALLALDLTSRHHRWELADTASGVSRSADLSLGDDERNSLKSRLAALLVSPLVRPLSKASSLARAYPRMLHTSAVLVDLRPVFDTDASSEPLATLLAPTLHVEFWNEEGNIATTSFALDIEDVEELRDACQRALEKASTISGMFNKIGFAVVDSSELGYDS